MIGQLIDAIGRIKEVGNQSSGKKKYRDYKTRMGLLNKTGMRHERRTGLNIGNI